MVTSGVIIGVMKWTKRALLLSHDVASGRDITSCIKIDKQLVVYGFGNVMK